MTRVIHVRIQLILDFNLKIKMKSSKIDEDRTTIRLSKGHNFFILRICPTMYILRKRSDFKFFEKQHGVTQKSNKSNKNNTLSKYAILGIWHIPTYFAVGQGQPRPNGRHFFWKGG